MEIVLEVVVDVDVSLLEVVDVLVSVMVVDVALQLTAGSSQQ